jgi:peptidoglycan/LPS O-acetylase OafA/YrhL
MTLARTGGQHFPVLDGVRGMAIVMVLCVHFIGDSPASTGLGRAMVKLANYGIWGVDLFFVLSGFLITGLLYDAKGSPRYFRNFYVRRTLRIFPLYYAVLALLFVLLPLLPTPYPAGLAESARHQSWLWLYASNVYLAIHRGWVLPYVGHFWSLAVEEQFYLLWPIVVLSFSRRSLLKLCVAVTVLAFALRSALAFAGAGGVAQLVLTPCRLDALCVGGFLALAVRCAPLARVARMARRSLGPLLCSILLVSGWNALQGSGASVLLPLRGTLIALTFGSVLAVSLDARTSTAWSRLLRSRVMCFLGTRSYGLYVFHGIIAYGLGEHPGILHRLRSSVGEDAGIILEAAAGAALSVAVAAISYELFEKRFLRLKSRLAPSGRAAAMAPLGAGSAE